jgi:hypothetical protein
MILMMNWTISSIPWNDVVSHFLILKCCRGNNLCFTKKDSLAVLLSKITIKLKTSPLAKSSAAGWNKVLE